MTSEIYLAGGCFWGMESAYRHIPGVIDVECGYANGDPLFIPDYMLVCSGKFGYRETIKVVYDPATISLDRLLWAFFFLIDATQERRQGNDVGEQYQTGIYWTDEASGETVRSYVAREAAHYPEFHTETGPLTSYTRAEEGHQRFLENNPRGYCHIPVLKMIMLAELPKYVPADLAELEWAMGNPYKRPRPMIVLNRASP